MISYHEKSKEEVLLNTLKPLYVFEIIKHIFLPRILIKSSSLIQNDLEVLFLHLIEDHLRNFLIKWADNPNAAAFSRISEIVSNWAQIQSSYYIDSNHLYNKLNELLKTKDNDNILPLYLINQNASYSSFFKNSGRKSKISYFMLILSSFFRLADYYV